MDRLLAMFGMVALGREAEKIPGSVPILAKLGFAGTRAHAASVSCRSSTLIDASFRFDTPEFRR